MVDLINEGKISHIVFIGGCDAPSPKMSSYERLTQLVQRDAIILTAACGKFRYNRRDYGTIEGMPRLLGFGQCNNVYSVIVIAAELAKRLGEDLN